MVVQVLTYKIWPSREYTKKHVIKLYRVTEKPCNPMMAYFYLYKKYGITFIASVENDPHLQWCMYLFSLQISLQIWYVTVMTVSRILLKYMSQTFQFL